MADATTPEAGNEKRTFVLAQMVRGGQLHIVQTSGGEAPEDGYPSVCGLQSDFYAWRATFDQMPELVRGGWICRRCRHIADLQHLTLRRATAHD